MVAGRSSLAPRLVRVPEPRQRALRWGEDARRVLAGADGFVRVLGGPGSGKTTLLAELAADRILRGGVDPEQLLVLTASRRAAADLRGRITALLTDQGAPRTVREPLVRTVHSYAFAVLRIQAMLHDGPGPRLLSGPEQDAVIRELLEGDIEMGAKHWPERLQPALAVPGFAEELRDLILRASERGLGPEDLIGLGEREGRDEWVAAGRFGRQYEQVTLLLGSADSGIAHTTAPALDAAELVASALLAFDTDNTLLTAERERVRYLLVDDAQHLDPLQYALLRTLGGAAKEFVVAGDPDQAIFSFRGADPALLRDADPGGGTVVLGAGHRMAPAVRKAVSHLAARLPGAVRRVDKGSDKGGTVTVRLHPSAAAEASWVANQLRRAHLIDGVPWADMAVLVRSATRSVPVLHRALAAAGVPVAAPGDELPLSQQPAVRPLLALLRCAAVPSVLDPAYAEMLLASQLGGADPLALRRLRRGLRRLELTSGGDKSSDELLVEVINDDDRLSALADTEAGPVRRVAGLIALARKGIEEGAGLEQILWDVWQTSGLEARWVGVASRGGPVGAQADRDLDAIVALFHTAQRYAERLPGSGVAGFVDHIVSQRIAGDTLAPSAPKGDAVAVLTAHAAAGREWTVVAVPGVQEGAWPDLRLRGSLLGVERLVDLLAGVGEEASATAPLLAEERRLLLVAASRARSKLLVSAVRGEEEQPSRFLAELAGADTADTDMPVPMAEQERALVLADLVGELRQVVCDAAADPARRGQAARQLARLAEAGVPGANPDSWYGLPELTTAVPLRDVDQPVRVSPSTVEILAKCPLRWMVERHGGQDPAELAAITGTLVHALAQAAASGVPRAELMSELDKAWHAVDAGAPWFSRREQQRVRAMVDTFLGWMGSTRTELTQVAVEREVTVELPDKITVAGRVDRLEVDADGRPVIVDIKTGKSPVSANDAQEHPQLAVYQLAVAYGAFTDVGTEPGGARLLYVAKPNKKTGATERVQTPVQGESAEHWLKIVREAAASTVGPEYAAYENPDCPRCPVRTACPLHPSGRQVTE
ncbi:superfamily I DNA/RNA helicase/RecB family exonuclease [Actinokineospora baliensis]|uniref:ATP-dependent helicase n=1 Tax=Actinokineospora baliensis TaxID=547056 RepID=UPI00195A5FCB|nr:ATP-dependent DNA helicase [Actinokineospora baliensis]MBM7772127.1 superfamily I DNA/RNA helicase/RecB family exonuclease [Actinokineospora baliensis]